MPVTEPEVGGYHHESYAVGRADDGDRSGDLDPSVVLELVKRCGADHVAQLLYRESGLLALSRGLSGDMQTLLSSDTADSRFAITYFCQNVAAAIGALAAKAGGVEALVFTGGIGEQSAEIRTRICASLAFLDIHLAPMANAGNEQLIHATGSKPVLRIQVDEEFEIAVLTGAALNRSA